MNENDNKENKDINLITKSPSSDIDNNRDNTILSGFPELLDLDTNYTGSELADHVFNLIENKIVEIIQTNPKIKKVLEESNDVKCMVMNGLPIKFAYTYSLTIKILFILMAYKSI
uniref:Uncharacterized protein n=1 Tax=Mimivirus LCMiAC01 TaxID=2506608 RepID=A0A481Z053_9VIRU|nr:MAG: hypothetical protein LCMiAC01_01240 [Mimivirus LCMiAC01]